MDGSIRFAMENICLGLPISLAKVESELSSTKLSTMERLIRYCRMSAPSDFWRIILMSEVREMYLVNQDPSSILQLDRTRIVTMEVYGNFHIHKSNQLLLAYEGAET